MDQVVPKNHKGNLCLLPGESPEVPGPAADLALRVGQPQVIGLF